MSKASDRSAWNVGRVTVLAIALAGTGAAAEVSFDPAAGAARDSGELRGSYQVRCWQKGRLILDESGVALPKDIATGAVKLQGRDRQQRPLFVVETANATCFVKPAAEARVPAPGLPGSGAR